MKEMQVEVLQDPSDALAAKRAKQRMDRCVMTPAEQELYAYAPNQARNNDRPGYPCEDYSE